MSNGIDQKDDMSSTGVVLDACALFPGSERDVLLRAAEGELYLFYTTDQILEETRRNLVKKKQMTEKQAKSLICQIKNFFTGCLVEDYERLILDMPINKKDRHVLAAAVASGSKIIVTQNLKDFPPQLLEGFGIKAMSADDFLVCLFSQEGGKAAMVNIVRDYASSLRKPPFTLQEILERLSKLVPNFVKLVQQELCKGDNDQVSNEVVDKSEET